MDWYGILLRARQLEKKTGYLSSPMLAKDLGVPGRVASAWMYKFERWGYVLRHGTMSSGGKRRWARYFKLTKWGMSRGKPKRKIKLKISKKEST